MTNHLELNEKLNTIGELVAAIRSNPHLTSQDLARRALLGFLSEIDDQVAALRHEIAGPRIVALYLADALEQVQRVTQLADEIELPPDPRQAQALGMACELAAEKFRAWRQLRQSAVSGARGAVLNSVPGMAEKEDGDELARAAA